MRLQRMWVNQPSTLQPDHALHGTRVLVAVDDWQNGDRSVQVWHVDGPIISRMMLKLALSNGWPSARGAPQPGGTQGMIPGRVQPSKEG